MITTWRRALPVALALSAWLACSGSGAAAEVEVYRADGSIQCHNLSGIPIEEMEAELAAAGVHVLGRRSGSDGLARIALCEEPTGAIHIFRIPAHQVGIATGLGFSVLDPA